MNQITDELLRLISGIKSGELKGAYNIREDGQCAARQSSENITIESKTDAPGLVIHIKPGTKGETVYIPACVVLIHRGVAVYYIFADKPVQPVVLIRRYQLIIAVPYLLDVIVNNEIKSPASYFCT